MADEGGTIAILADDPRYEPRFDPENKSISIDDAEGGTLVYLDVPPSPEKEREKTHFENLAEVLDEGVRAKIVNEVLLGIEADIQSRQEWSDMRAEGIKMLGTTIEKAGGDAVNSSQSTE